MDPGRLDDQVLGVCDFLVIGTPVYQGKMLIRDWLSQNRERLGATRLFVFVVGTDLVEPSKRLAVIRENIPTGMLASCELYFLPGRLIVDRLSAADAGYLGIGSRDGEVQDGELVKKGNIEGLVGAVRLFTHLFAGLFFFFAGAGALGAFISFA